MKQNEIKSVEKNFISYMKNDIIKKVEAPNFGSVTIYFQDGKTTHVERKETIK